MTSLRERQKYHSELMRVLAASKFKNPQSESSNADHRTKETNRDIGYLETIALYMVSGEDGDVIASAFEETKLGISIVLAKNTKASEKDHEDACHFLSYLENTKVDWLLGSIPFLISRGSTNIQARITKVGNLTEGLRVRMSRGIEAYVRSFSAGGHFLDEEEFPDRGQDLKKLWIKMGTAEVYGVERGLHKILDICRSKPTITDDDPASHQLFQELILAAAALVDSKFFEAFTANEADGKNGDGIVPKLWRNLDKLRQYLHIEKLVKFVQDKRHKFTIRWVSEEISVPKHMEELRQIEIRKVQEVTVELGKKHTQIAKTEAQVEKMFKSRSLYWKTDKDKLCKNKRIWPKLHAEIQIIHALGKPMTRSSSNVAKPQRAIGCSKRSCLQCWLYLKKVNELLSEEWMTAGDHSWPYETAALTGSHPELDPKGLCDAYIIETVQKFAISQVKQLYGLQPTQPFHKRKKSDENATASGSSDGSSEESDSDSRSDSGTKPQNLGRSIHT